MPFLVSVTESKTPVVQQNLEPVGGQVYPGKAIILFPDASGQKQDFIDFCARRGWNQGDTVSAFKLF